MGNESKLAQAHCGNNGPKIGNWPKKVGPKYNQNSIHIKPIKTLYYSIFFNKYKILISKTSIYIF